MTRLRNWWRRQVFWHRFTHNRCTRCGKHTPMVGSTTCSVCLAEMRGW